MRIPLSWLREVLQTKRSPEEIAESLTHAGLEVDHIIPTSRSFEGVVVAEVRSTKPHPDADRLAVAQVFDGTEEFQVVCGASNCRPGIKVALARVGATLQPEGDKPFKIKRSKLRGVESEGMVCAAVELGLGAEAKGIIELPSQYETGRDLADYYGDTVLELSLTPNLGHCFSILGVARELAAITGESLAAQSLRVEESATLTKGLIDVQIEDFEACPRYACRIVQGVRVGPSPEWLQRRLEACGMRSVNNVVDVTNLVMLELGQPLHAFDLDRVRNGRVVIRHAKAAESFTTLDDVERKLSEDNLLICDGEGPVAIAGVMGGQESEVSETTVKILLEAAHFEASTVRRSAKQLGLHTESSKRFERGCDPNAVLPALDRAATLIQELAGGEILHGVVDVRVREFESRQIELRLNRLNSLLGTQLGMTEVESLLKRHNCDVTTLEDTLRIQVPTYRSDLKLEVDLIEEVARLYGYANISRRAPAFSVSELPHTPLFLFEREVRRALIGAGLQELLTSNLISPHLAASAPSETSWIEVMNPSSQEQSVLRSSLLPGLLQVVKHNANHQIRDMNGFEIGRVHFSDGEEVGELTLLGIILSGNRDPIFWDAKERRADFYDLKGMIEDLLARFAVGSVTFERSSLPHLHPGRQAHLRIAEREVGIIGELHPAKLRAFDRKREVLFAEIDLPALLASSGVTPMFHALPHYPGSSRDWTVTLSEPTPFADCYNAIEQVPSRLLKKVALIAIYRGASVGDGWKNVTFRFFYRDDRKTVSVETVEAEHQRIQAQVYKQLGEKVRT